MVNTARSFCPSQPRMIKTLVVVSAIAAAALVFTQSTWAAAGNTQICAPSTSCTIGEFLYNDSYAPLTTATCTITSRYPNGTLFLNAAAMTVSAEGDAWYSRTFTAPATLGLYRTEVKCIVGSDVMALDKTFEIKTDTSAPSANDVAAATWSYSTRSLSTFGTLIADIWSYAARTLTGVGLTSGTIATKADFEKVNNPVTIDVILDYGDDKSSSLQDKIDESKKVAQRLNANARYLKAKTSLVNSTWRTINVKDVGRIIGSLANIVGQPKDKSGNSIFASSNFLISSWGWSEASQVSSEARSINTKLSSLALKIKKSGKSPSVRNDLLSLTQPIIRLEKLTGTSSSAKTKTILQKISEAEKLSQALNEKEKHITKIISSWGKSNRDKTALEVKKLSSEVFSLNTLPKLPTSSPKVLGQDSEKNLKNQAFSLLGIINANKIHLAQAEGAAFSSTWLELGSIVFKTIITNPSNAISQTVPVKYYLPAEVKREDVIDIDEGLSVNFDTEKNRYYFSGTFTLAPNESRTLSVRVDDSVFEISEKEVASLRKQAESLFEPLKNTSYFAQGVTLKSDIDVSLDRILSMTAEAATPEEKIKSYREAKIELDAAKNKIDKLKDLVTAAGSVGTFFGFVGGTQTLAVWGMIIIMGAGFVFLALYMRTIAANTTNATLSTPPKASNTAGKSMKAEIPAKSTISEEDGRPRPRNRRSLTVGLILFGLFIGAGIAIAGMSFLKIGASKLAQHEAKVVAQKTEEKEVLGESQEASSSAKITIFVPEDSTVDVYSEASIDSQVLFTLKKSQDAVQIQEKGNWVKIELQNGKEKIAGWVDGDFVEQANESGGTDIDNKTVRVLEDLTSYLKIRNAPIDGEVIGKAYAGNEFAFVSEEDVWIEIELSDGTTGWVDGDFVTAGPR